MYSYFFLSLKFDKLKIELFIALLQFEIHQLAGSGAGG